MNLNVWKGASAGCGGRPDFLPEKDIGIQIARNITENAPLQLEKIDRPTAGAYGNRKDEAGMKKILAAILAASLALTLVACGAPAEQTGDEWQLRREKLTQEEVEQAPTEDQLVVLDTD